jgi:hypothetical protein
MRAVRFTCHKEGVSGADPKGLDFASPHGCRAPPPAFLSPPKVETRGRTRSQSVGDDIERLAVPRPEIPNTEPARPKVTNEAADGQMEEVVGEGDGWPPGSQGARRGSWCVAGGAGNEDSKSPRAKEKEYMERRSRRERNLRRSYETKDLEIFNLLRVPVWVFDFKKRQMLWCNIEGLEVRPFSSCLPPPTRARLTAACTTVVVGRHSRGAACPRLGWRHVAGDSGSECHTADHHDLRAEC